MFFDKKAKSKVVLTRVESLAEKSLQALQNAGFECENIPLIQIVENSQAVKKLQNLNLSFYSKIILISPTTAQIFLQTLKVLHNTEKSKNLERSKNRLALKFKNLHFFAVGKQTCNHLVQVGFNCRFPKSGDKAEDLLDFLKSEQGGVNSKDRFLILKGEGGRNFLIPEIAKFAEVDFIDLYKRTKPELSASQVFTLLQEEILALVINSQTALENLVFFMQMQKSDWRLGQNLLVSSARIGEKAKKYGFKKITNTQTASIDSVINKLKSLN